MDKNANHVDTIQYVLTFISIVTLVSCFATHLITGNPAIIPMDSLLGSILIGIVFFCYGIWFIYESKIKEQLSTKEAIIFNLKTNPAVISMYFFWFVFVFVPIMITLFR